MGTRLDTQKSIILFLSIVIVALGFWSYVLDSQWSKAYARKGQIDFSRGYWKGFYDLCVYSTTGNYYYCNNKARIGYNLDIHNDSVVKGFDWQYIRLGQVY
jgi:hypothetical protein